MAKRKGCSGVFSKSMDADKTRTELVPACACVHGAAGEGGGVMCQQKTELTQSVQTVGN